ENERAGAAVDQDAALDRRLVDALGAELAQMVDLRHVGARIEAEEAVVERGRQRQRKGTAEAGFIEPRRGGDHRLQRLSGIAPAGAVDMVAAFGGEEPVEVKIG